ncbi:MAG: hypothetical protein ACK5MT_01580 [Actinomycetales bacterium]
MYSFILNYLPFMLSAIIFGKAYGWTIHALGEAVPSIEEPGRRVVRAWEYLPALVLGLMLLGVILVMVRRFSDGHMSVSGYGRTKSEPWAGSILALTLFASVLAVLPLLTAPYATASSWVLTHILRDYLGSFSDSLLNRIAVATVWLVLLVLMTAISLWLGQQFRIPRLMMMLSAFAGAGLLLVPVVSAMELAARRGFTWEGLGVTGASGAIILIMGVAAHNRRYSLHLFYRERLNSAFAVEREESSKKAKPIDYAERLLFSEIGELVSRASDDKENAIPKLVVCCAVNLTSDVPSGRFAESFTFESDWSGSPVLGYHATKDLEGYPGPKGTQLTLPAMMALSGAALSPIMGRYTYPPLRFLMALTGVRLGVWVPNPCRDGWRKPTTSLGTSAAGAGLIKRQWSRVKQGWYEPGALYVLREALGILSLKRRYIYLTDGGHWENLGLVELLRRRCTDVICFDASCDSEGSDLSRAIGLARSDLGAKVSIDPGAVLCEKKELADDVAVRGSVEYQNPPSHARLVYAKAVLSTETSWDLLAYGRRDSRFPNHPTSKQIFTDEQFEGYRSLGYEAGLKAAGLLSLPPLEDGRGKR